MCPPIVYILAETEEFLNSCDYDDDESITICSVETGATPNQLLDQVGRQFGLLQSRWESERRLGGTSEPLPNRRASLTLEISAYEHLDGEREDSEQPDISSHEACTQGPKCPHRRASLVLSLSAYEAAAQTINAQRKEPMGSICETKCDLSENEARKQDALCSRRKLSLVLQPREGNEAEKEIQRGGMPKYPSRRGSVGSLGSLSSLADLGSLVLSLASQEIAEKLEAKKGGTENETSKCSVPRCPCRRASSASIDKMLLGYENPDTKDPSASSENQASAGDAPTKPLRRISIMLSFSEADSLEGSSEKPTRSSSESTLPPKLPCRKASMGLDGSEEELEVPRRESNNESIALSSDGHRRLSSVVPDLMAFDIE